MKKLILTMLISTLLVPNFMVAQSYSKAEQKVINAVNDYWAIFFGKNKDEWIKVFHKSYKGWRINREFLINKEALVKEIDYNWGKSDNLYWSVTPIGVQLYDDIAIVHYYYNIIDKNKKTSKITTEKGRYTDILLNDRGKWKIISDIGGKTESKTEE